MWPEERPGVSRLKVTCSGRAFAAEAIVEKEEVFLLRAIFCGCKMLIERRPFTNVIEMDHVRGGGYTTSYCLSRIISYIRISYPTSPTSWYRFLGS